MISGEIPAPNPVKADPGNRSEHSSATPLAVVDRGMDTRGVALAILTTVAMIYALAWAQSYIISLLLGIR